MKKFMLCIAVFCLAACIPVEDFGAYWDKGIVDHALQGTWEEVTSDPAKKGEMKITEKDGVDFFESLAEEDKKKDREEITARSLAAGSYTFLMAVDKSDIATGKDKDHPPIKGLIRYDVKDGVFRQYTLNDIPMVAFLKEKYPSAKNIEVKKFMSSDSVEVKTLDDEAFKILSDIPDTGVFWKLQGEWHKKP